MGLSVLLSWFAFNWLGRNRLWSLDRLVGYNGLVPGLSGFWLLVNSASCRLSLNGFWP